MMRDDDEPRPLTDNEAHAMLDGMARQLVMAHGATTHAETALRAAEQAIILLMLGLLAASDRANGFPATEPPPSREP
jgi:hypothetical protein